MSVFDAAIADFGRRLGIAGLAPGAGVVGLDFAGLGRVQLEEAEPWAFVTLARLLPPYDGGIPARLLAVCHWRENHPVDIHPGVMGGEAMVLTARVPLMEFTTQTIDDLIRRLADMLDRVEEK